MCVYVCVCVHSCVYVQVYVCACAYVRVHVYMCTCMYEYICICVYVCLLRVQLWHRHEGRKASLLIRNFMEETLGEVGLQGAQTSESRNWGLWVGR